MKVIFHQGLAKLEVSWRKRRLEVGSWKLEVGAVHTVCSLVVTRSPTFIYVFY